MIKLELSDYSNTMLRDCSETDISKRGRYGKQPLSEYYESQNEYETKERFFNFDHTPINEIDIENGCYDIVIVEGWKPEQGIDYVGQDSEWNGEGELLAEISVEMQPLSSPSRCPTPPEPDDCANLSWLLNFRLDDIINSHNEEQPLTVTDGVKKITSKRDNSPECVPDDLPVSTEDVAAQKKPPYTYTEMIELALRDKGELTVSGIYQWISERFPFFRPQDDRWKNSVRHNLSINPHFRKGAKASRGAGHLWTIAAPSAALDRVLANAFNARRMQAAQSLEQEAAEAAASILHHHNSEFMNPVSAELVAAECGLLDADMTFHY